MTQLGDGQIRVYGLDGSLIRTIGRTGEGPGEFRWLVGVGFLGDTLYATDWALPRVSLFDLGGHYLSSAVWPTTFEPTQVYSGGVILIRAPQILRRDGSGISHIVFGQPRRPERGGVQHLVHFSLMFHVTRDSERRDTIAWIETRQRTNTVPVPGADPAGIWCPFAWDPIGAPMVDGSGAVIVDRPDPPTEAPEFRVTRVDERGDTLAVETVPYDPVPLDDNLLDSHIEGMRSRRIERGDAAPSGAAIRDALREVDCLPGSLPPVSAVVPSQDGTIWLSMSSAGGEEVDWQVLGTGGQPIGLVRIPVPGVVATAQDDILVTREVDELGVPHLTVYRVGRR